jgi:hypothetical protein
MRFSSSMKACVSARLADPARFSTAKRWTPSSLDRLAVVEDRPGGEIAVVVGVWLEQLSRKAVGEIVENVFARRDVNLDVGPFLGRNLQQAPFHQRFAGRYDLDDGGVDGIKIAIDRRDQRRRLHGGDEMIEGNHVRLPLFTAFRFV